MFFASSISATDRRIDTGRVAFALACSSSVLRTAGFVRGLRDPEERTSVPSLSARSNSRCVCRRPSGLAYQSVSSVLDLDSWSFVDSRGIDSSLPLIHGMSTWPTLCRSESKPLTPSSTALVYTVSVYTKAPHSISDIPYIGNCVRDRGRRWLYPVALFRNCGRP